MMDGTVSSSSDFMRVVHGPTAVQVHTLPGIAVWIAHVDDVLGNGRLLSWLDSVDYSRLKCIARDTSRRQRAAGRILLRCALSQAAHPCAAVAPDEWAFDVDTNGKPFVQARGELPTPRFSISYSFDLVAVAVSFRQEIGIDIESTHVPRHACIPVEFLTAAEQNALNLLPLTQCWPRFVKLWTIKEACVKAIGLGLSLDPSLLNVDLAKLCVEIDDPVGGKHAVARYFSSELCARNSSYALAVAELVAELPRELSPILGCQSALNIDDQYDASSTPLAITTAPEMKIADLWFVAEAAALDACYGSGAKPDGAQLILRDSD